MGGWKPIDTAPRDGTWILACGHSAGFVKPIVLRWHRDGWTTWRDHGDYHDPSHWQALDAPPDEAPVREWYRDPT